MSDATHNRLAEILSDIEARCVKYKRAPLEAAQQWADENWSLGDSPLSEVVTAGVRYCQLNSMDQTIGFDLNKLGTQVCRFLDMSLTEGQARVDLYGAVIELHEFAHGVRREIECSATSKSNGAIGDPTSKGRQIANNNAPVSDGPVEGYRWAHNCKVTSDTMQPKAWKLAEFLWKRPMRTADFDTLALPVYDRHGHTVTEHAIGSLRKQANSFFSQHGIPLLVSIKQGIVRLEMPSAADCPPVAQ
jgi:hypothetical protein